MSEDATRDATPTRWRSRPILSALVRLLAFGLPVAAGVMSAILLSRLLSTPESPGQAVVWWLAVFGGGTAAIWLVDRAARRLLPLAALLGLTMGFPDQTPSRFRLALRSGSSRRNLRQLVEEGDPLEEAAASDILLLASELNSHDSSTRGHSERVRAYTDLLAEELRLDEPDRDRLRWAALLHDIGKLEIPSEILDKEGPLTPGEWKLMRQHPHLGMRIAGPILPWLGRWAETIGHHHERYDGRGYPLGLSGGDINMGARIVAVADAFDVMTSARSYARPVSADAARRELTMEAGRQFDPDVVRALFSLSLGRLRWVAGPVSWLAQLPLIADLRGMLHWVGSAGQTIAATAAIVIGSAAGLLDLPFDLPEPGAETVQVAGLANEESPPGAVAALFDDPLSRSSFATTTLPSAVTTTTSSAVTTAAIPPVTTSSPVVTTAAIPPVTTSSPVVTTAAIPPVTTTSPVTTSTIPPVTTTTVPLVTTTTLPPSSTFTLYLHNSPSPPAGSTNSQPVLPMDPAVPGGGTLHNYDTDRDGAAGLLLAKSSAGIAEGDPTKYQIWSYATSSDTYVGQVTMTFWSSMIDFQVTERGRLQMRLMDCDAAGSSCINLAIKNVRIDPWNGGVADWVSHTISFARVDHTIPGGRTLRLKVVVGSSSGNDMWFAYDTSSYRSRLLIEP